MRLGIITLAAVLLAAIAAPAAAFNTIWAYGSATRYYTEEDWAAEDRNILEALNNNPDGTASTWRGEKSKIEGTATPLRSYTNDQGQTCRLLQLTAKRMEQTDRAAGHFCRDSGGKWVLVGMAKIKDPSGRGR